jgi:hypothetical protein
LATANFIAYLPYITIQSDGSIKPETEFITQTGNVYTLTGDIYRKYAIIIKRSNIVLDGAGHKIDGSASILGYSNIGLQLEGVTNVTVKDIEIDGFINRDISIEQCSKCRIFRVKAQIFHLWNSSFNTIAESSVGGEHGELLLQFSDNNVIVRSSVAYLHINGEANIIAKNNVTKAFYGGGSKNNVIANRISWFYLTGFNNTFCANEIDWFRIESASNLFYDNNFINVNPPELTIYHGERGPFFWDNGEEGNYWKRNVGTDANNDGVCDLPYTVDARYFDPDLEKNVVVACGSDNYPLMSPFDIDDVGIWLPEWAVLDLELDQSILIQSPQNTTYTATDVPLNFTAPNSAMWARYSLDGQANVTITGNLNLTGLAVGSHNLTLYVDDLLGNTRSSETIYFTIAKVSEPFPASLVIITSGLTTAFAGISLLIYFKKRKH